MYPLIIGLIWIASIFIFRLIKFMLVKYYNDSFQAIEILLLLVLLLTLMRILVPDTILLNSISFDVGFWLYSATAQTIAAFIALLLSGYIFMHSITEKNQQKQSTRESKTDRSPDLIKIRYYYYISILSFITAISIILNLFLIIVNKNFFSFKSFLIQLCLTSTTVAILGGVNFIIEVLDPRRYLKEIEKIEIDYKTFEDTKFKTTQIKSGINTWDRFLGDFIRLEILIRNFCLSRKFNEVNNDYMSFTTMLNMLRKNAVINNDIFDRLITISKYRNLLVHGHINEVDEKLAIDLRRIMMQMRYIFRNYKS